MRPPEPPEPVRGGCQRHQTRGLVSPTFMINGRWLQQLSSCMTLTLLMARQPRKYFRMLGRLENVVGAALSRIVLEFGQVFCITACLPAA